MLDSTIDTIEGTDLLDSLGGSEQQAASTLAYKPKSYGAKEGITSVTEDRALQLLGSGVMPEAVAAALGVTPSRISQLLSRDDFAEKVAVLRYETLQSHNKRDAAYDDIEDQLLDKLKKSLPLMFKPEVILRAIATINGAKRRGQSAPQQTVNQQTIVSLTLPTSIAARFTVNIDNQVVRAGEQDLITIQSSNLMSMIDKEEAAISGAKGVTYESAST